MIEIKNLSYHYRKQRTAVLDRITATFDEGRFYAIIGESGSGKTTLLSLLAGLDVPTEGAVYANGTDIRSIGLTRYRRRYVSLVFQNYNLIDYLTAAENVRLGFAQKRHTDKDNAVTLLEDVGLTPDIACRSVLRLSGGQQQRVAIARALAAGAPTLLADEPTGNLDAATSEGIINLLARTARERKKCVIAVTHSPRLAAAADVVLRLEKGKLWQQ